MRFFTFGTLALAALATAQADFKATDASTGENEIAAAKSCKPNHDYCGYYLKNTLGWKGITNNNGLYRCRSPKKADRIMTCRKCKGPKAHCA